MDTLKKEIPDFDKLQELEKSETLKKVIYSERTVKDLINQAFSKPKKT